MPRIRTIKPEFWSDEKLAKCDPLTRLVFLGLISQADDAGRLIDSVKLIDGALFPATDDSCKDALQTLASLARILRYESESGQGIIQIIGWPKHQKVEHPSRYVLPAPSERAFLQVGKSQRHRRGLVRRSRNGHENGGKVSGDPHASTLDLGPTTNEHGSTDSSGSEKPNTDVSIVFDYWVLKTGRDPARTKLTNEREAKIKARLKRFNAGELKAAIDGLMLSEFHTSKPEYTDLISCFGNETKVESHIARAAAGVTVSDSRPDADDAWVDQMQKELI